MILKEIPYREWPREKAMREGVDKLSNIELLSIFLRSGSKDENVLEVAKNVLYSLRNLNDLNKITKEELMKVKGIGPAKAITVLAAIELGKRLKEEEQYLELKLQSPLDFFRFFRLKVSNFNQEHLYVVYFKNHLKVIDYKLISIGSSNEVICDYKEIFSWAVRLGAGAIVLVHNHPSGNPIPSKADIEVTKMVINQAKLFKILVLDHIIIGENYFSFLENKLM